MSDRSDSVARPRGRGRFRGRAGALVAALATSLSFASVALSDEPERPTIHIGWTKTPPKLDGRIDPGEWQDAARVDGLTQALPDEGAPPTQRTEVFIMTDEDHLYVAARLWDTDPSQIVRNTMARDVSTRRDDRFGFTIDPFLDRQNGYFFQVNSNSVRRDALLEGGQSESSWDGRWFAKATIDDEGWTVEIALPYQSINFDPDTNVWGFNMARGIRRRDEIDRWADPVRERFLTAMGRAGNLVGMKGIRQGLGIQAIPSLTLRRVDDSGLPSDDPGGDERHYSRVDPSFDAFYKVTPSVTASVTTRTDFGETEVDDRQVNFGRFALFFPERRDFFLQDALIFDFGDLSENGRPFFSRTIGLDEEGEPVDLLGGGKVTGRVGNVKFGLLDVVIDEKRRSDQQNLFVGRAAANFGESTVGGIVTHGEPDGDGNNTVAGLDFIYRNTNFRGGKTFRAVAWGQVSHNDPHQTPIEDPPVRGTGYAYGGRVSYPNDKHNWEVVGNVFDEKFAPALGFANRVGIREFRGNYRRRWRPSGSIFQTIDTRIEGSLITEQGRQVETGSLFWRPIEVQNFVNDGFRFEYRHTYDVVTAENPLSFNTPPGRYHFDEGRFRFTTSENRAVVATVALGYGTFYDGTRARVASDVTLRFSRNVQAGLIYNYDNLRLPGGDENIHLVRARLSLFFTADISWVTLVQYDNVTDQVGVNSRFRWIIEDGREVFFVLNQGLDTRDDVRATRTAPLAKVQWTFWF
ncbi:MAG: carbohydrate binding family 9 domain-containing protein [Myxococcota bacterium]